MSIASMMYFALGALASGLLMLLLLPAVWRRAVRLTRKRIEAATPITLAEFRADKDQLRAEFALSTRRLELNVEQLRKRLSEQMGDVNRKRTDLASLKGERDERLAAVHDLEEREAQLRSRILDLERESTDLAQRLSMRDRELAERTEELSEARVALMAKLPRSIRADGRPLSGNYDADVDELMAALAVERKRAGFLEEQAQGLIAQLEKSDKRSVELNAAMAELRRNLVSKQDAASGTTQSLVEAEVRIANAESRLNSLLEQTTDIVAKGAEKNQQLLADKLSLESQLEQLQEKVKGVESTVMADWDTDRIEQSHLRERLNDIASDVSRLVYAVDTQSPTDPEESLFDRVQRFADDGMRVDTFPVAPPQPARAASAVRPLAPPAPPARPGVSSVADRMAALRELQGRH